MGISGVKPVYFFHIPKTGGRFLFLNTANVLKYEFLKQGLGPKQYLKCMGHISFKPIDTVDMFSFSNIREPVSRAISHYLHIYQQLPSGDIKKDKSRLFEFLEKYPDSGIINYQTKYISYDGDDEVIEIFDANLPKDINENDYNRAKDRLSKLDYLFDTRDMNHNVTNILLDKMYDNFNIKNNNPRIQVDHNSIVNKDSSELYQSLNAKEIKLIEDMMPYDVELYRTANIFDINKLG